MFAIERKYIQAMIAHAQADAPNECCGILGGADGRVLKAFPATNAEHSPYRYNLDPRELLQIWREVEGNGWQFVGIYHSHVFSEARPSPTDVRLALWPESLYFIVSLADPLVPVVRAYRIKDGVVMEEELNIIDATP